MKALHDRLLDRGRQLRRALTQIRMSHREREPRVVLVPLWPILQYHRLPQDLEDELRKVLRGAMESGIDKRITAGELVRVADLIAKCPIVDDKSVTIALGNSGSKDGDGPEARVREASRILKLIAALEEEEEREDAVVKEATFALEAIVRRLLAAGLEQEAARMRGLGQASFYQPRNRVSNKNPGRRIANPGAWCFAAGFV